MIRASLLNKSELRKVFLSLRKNISEPRRVEAKEKAFEALKKIRSEKILSFFPLPSEIHLEPLNRYWMKKKKLFLPKVVKQELWIYSVPNLSSLTLSKKGIWEPNPDKCQRASPSDMDLILVPALAFDQAKNRIGYGGGYYDRLLEKEHQAYTIGVGFTEQLSPYPLPSDLWDIPLKELLLF